MNDRQRVEHAVPMMLLGLMITSNIKHNEEGSHEALYMLEMLSDYANQILTHDIIRRRAHRAYKELAGWMRKGRFTTRKAMYVVLQLVYLLAEKGIITYPEGTPFYDALNSLGEIYDGHLQEALGDEYQKFEKGVLKAVLELAQKMQGLGYFQQVEFIKKAA